MTHIQARMKATTAASPYHGSSFAFCPENDWSSLLHESENSSYLFEYYKYLSPSIDFLNWILSSGLGEAYRSFAPRSGKSKEEMLTAPAYSQLKDRRTDSHSSFTPLPLRKKRKQ